MGRDESEQEPSESSPSLTASVEVTSGGIELSVACRDRIVFIPKKQGVLQILVHLQLQNCTL